MITVVAFPNDETERYGVRVKRSFTVPSSRNLASIAQLVQAGEVVEHVDKVLPLEAVREALAQSEAGRVRGKIVLKVTD